jgi:hypothetical protein
MPSRPSIRGAEHVCLPTPSGPSAPAGGLTLNRFGRCDTNGLTPVANRAAPGRDEETPRSVGHGACSHQRVL